MCNYSFWSEYSIKAYCKLIHSIFIRRKKCPFSIHFQSFNKKVIKCSIFLKISHSINFFDTLKIAKNSNYVLRNFQHSKHSPQDMFTSLVFPISPDELTFMDFHWSINFPARRKSSPRYDTSSPKGGEEKSRDELGFVICTVWGYFELRSVQTTAVRYNSRFPVRTNDTRRQSESGEIGEKPGPVVTFNESSGAQCCDEPQSFDKPRISRACFLCSTTKLVAEEHFCGLMESSNYRGLVCGSPSGGDRMNSSSIGVY